MVHGDCAVIRRYAPFIAFAAVCAIVYVALRHFLGQDMARFIVVTGLFVWALSGAAKFYGEDKE